jgi:hypothetical protein
LHELNSGEREFAFSGVFADRKLSERLSWNREQLTTFFQERSRSQRARKASWLDRSKRVEKRDWAILKRTFLRPTMTVLAHSLATRRQKYLV